jgi:formate hydrogenlyase transcriptional activator
VRAGRFRQDLWYRLSVFPITIPPLRQRPEDIPLLLGHFIEKHCRKVGRPLLQISRATMKDLQAREWPGNVRELENVVERAVISSRGATFDMSDDVRVSAEGALDASGSPGGPQTLEQLEHAHIVSTLERLHWRVEGDRGAAAVLGVNSSTLRSRMRKLGIRRPGSRPVDAES